MGITYDAGTVSEVIKMFMSLNEARQAKAFSDLYMLCLEQYAEDELGKVDKSGCHSKKTSVVEYKNAVNKSVQERLERISEFMDLIDKLNDTNKAALAMELESIRPGAFTKQEDVSLTINSKTVPLEQYLKSALPKADLESARKILKEMEAK